MSVVTHVVVLRYSTLVFRCSRCCDALLLYVVYSTWLYSLLVTTLIKG